MSVAPRARFDTPPDLRAARWAAGQHGCIRSDQLAACGLDRAAVARRVRKGWLHRVHTGVYAVGYASDTLHAQFMAAALAGGQDAHLSHRASCALAGLVRWDRRLIDVTVRGSAKRSRPGIRFHRARSLDPRDTTRLHGIPCTTPARAILEIAAQLSDTRLKRLVRQAQAERLANTRQIADVLGRANGHAATARIAAIIATGAAPTASGHEDVVLDLILRAGFEHPVVNGPVRTKATTYFPDLRWPAQRLILEVDSGWHDGHIAQGLDAARQADLEAVGERVLRTTREQALIAPDQLVTRLAAAGAPRAPPKGRTIAPYTDAQP
ncbi:MAG: type IV toxin-antitoxin system AbiEi family antitoxin domain-containing protein [Solirubrobacterales bacterium]|nr:type IV toxin-antitoxin system AbiEi family antitoxin domain-containing protein [Solirubrobacterales bacterium]